MNATRAIPATIHTIQRIRSPGRRVGQVRSALQVQAPPPGLQSPAEAGNWKPEAGCFLEGEAGAELDTAGVVGHARQLAEARVRLLPGGVVERRRRIHGGPLIGVEGVV